MSHPRALLSGLALTLAACAGPAADHHDHTPEVLDRAEARTIDFPGHQVRVLLDAEALEGDVAVFELTVAPRTLGAPPHVHANEDESFYVLEGELVFLSGEDEMRCGPGTVANLPRGHVHGFWNAGDAPARVLLTISPAHFGSFFDEVVSELRERQLTDRAAVGELLGEVAGRYGCTVDGSRIGSIVERYGLQ